MLIVAALGGNALLRRGEGLDAETQRRNVAAAAAALAPLARDHRLVITHGNGPQIGLLALQAEAYRPVPAYPLDLLGAESQGMIGYLIERALAPLLPGRPIATVLTQVVVNPADPALANPTKPIGPLYAATEAAQLASERHWQFVPDAEHMRRVVPSPEPVAIREIAAIRLLLNGGAVVICAGGGGIPVAVEPDGAWRGVEAVIDKDLTSALLAIELAADRLLLLTDVDAVYLGWPTPAAGPIRNAGCASLAALEFEAGSMGPKVKAACRFVGRTRRSAAIGAIGDCGDILAGRAGTTILPGDVPIEHR